MSETRPMLVFEVEVDHFGIGLVHAATAAKARYEAYLSDAFSHWTFREFLTHVKVRKAPDPESDGYERLRQQYPDAVIPKPGTRITAERLTGTVLPALRPTSYVVFQPDGQEREAFVHPMSVALLETTDDH